MRRSARSNSPGLSLGFSAGACFIAAGFIVGLRPLADNSFFTHLATGRLILERGSVPSTDPYTFTAGGEPWVVQSWLASWLYATVEALAGAAGLRLLMGIIVGTVAALVWRLSRPATAVVVRFALCSVVLVASASLWAERPFMLGLVALGVVVLAGEGGLNPVWLAPLGWLWANTHGSYPLGLVYLAAAAVGSRLDGSTTRTELRALGWLAGGIAAGAVGPLGLDVLSFPLDLVQKQDVLENVTEWRPPVFDSVGQRVFLLQALAAVALLVRRPRYRSATVLIVFVAAALLGVRNLPVACLVLVPGMAAALPALGSLRNDGRGPLARAFVVVAAVVVVVIGSARLGARDYAFDRYPVDATAFVLAQGAQLDEIRLVAPDIAGNFRELVFGAQGDVYYDDRFDMFPLEVTWDHLALIQGGLGSRRALDRAGVTHVLWKRGSGVAQQLAADPDWRVLYSDERWVVACRRSGGGAAGSAPDRVSC